MNLPSKKVKSDVINFVDKYCRKTWENQLRKSAEKLTKYCENVHQSYQNLRKKNLRKQIKNRDESFVVKKLNFWKISISLFKIWNFFNKISFFFWKSRKVLFSSWVFNCRHLTLHPLTTTQSSSYSVEKLDWRWQSFCRNSLACKLTLTKFAKKNLFVWNTKIFRPSFLTHIFAHSLCNRINCRRACHFFI